jgi:hypothetical protein
MNANAIPASVSAGLTPAVRELLADLAAREAQLLVDASHPPTPDRARTLQALRIERAMLLGSLRAR